MSRHLLDNNARLPALYERLRQHRLQMERVGIEWGRAEWLDENILSKLNGSKKTFHSLDADFFRREYCNSTYCLVFYDYVVRNDEQARAVADVIARFIRHPNFRTHTQRLGKVTRVTNSHIECYEVGHRELQRVQWQSSMR